MTTVIIPVYNTEKYLNRCIDSVIAQTDADWELLLVDDESNDNSGRICDEYASKYDNIRVIHQKNSGPAAARRVGVENANGELIMFVDADDWVDSNIIKILKREMDLSKSDVVICGYADIYKNGKREDNSIQAKEPIECVGFEQIITEIHGTRNISTGPWAKLYRRELFEGIDYRENITIGEDYTMLLQVLHNAHKVRLISNILYNRWMYGGNISRSGYTARHKKALENYIEVRNGLINAYPNKRIEILGYHIEYEMAVITAMCRNCNYDKKVIKKLSHDLKDNMNDIIKRCNIPVYMKGCSIMIAYMPHLFIFLFRLLHVLTGR